MWEGEDETPYGEGKGPTPKQRWVVLYLLSLYYIAIKLIAVIQCEICIFTAVHDILYRNFYD
jgi:hypothetical protein